MAEGRGKAEWARTSAVLAMLVNVNRARGKPVSPDQFNPYGKRRKPAEKGIEVPMSVLHEMLRPAIAAQQQQQQQKRP